MYTTEEIDHIASLAFILGAIANDRYMVGVIPQHELNAAHALCDVLEVIETFAGACHDL